jgi:enoyl-CoA hydratase
VPIIATINGPAVTGGFELGLACDVIVASEWAAFADTHLRVGVYPGPVLVELGEPDGASSTATTGPRVRRNAVPGELGGGRSA